MIAVAVTLLLCAAWLGCGGRTADDDTIVFWAFGAEGENVQHLLPEFERRNPGVKVRLQVIPWTAAHEKLLTAFAGNSTPDICQLGNTWIPEFTILNAIEDMGPWLERSGRIKKENYFAGIWSTNLIDGRPFGIPWYVDTRVFFYRKDYLAAAGYPSFPRTWSELRDACAKIVRHGPQREHYGIFMPTSEWAPPVILGLQAGSTLLREGGRYGDFSGPRFKEAFSYYVSFFQEGLAPIGVTQVTNIYQGIAEGFFAIYMSGPWNIGEFRRRLPESMQGNWMTAPLPGLTADTPGVSLAGGSSLAMFKGSRRKEQVWKLIEYLSAPEQQIAFYKITGDLPAVRGAWEDSALAANPYVRAFYEQLLHVVALPQVPEWEQIAMKVQDYADIASRGTMTVDQALAALDRDVDVILEKRRWMKDNEVTGDNGVNAMKTMGTIGY